MQPSALHSSRVPINVRVPERLVVGPVERFQDCMLACLLSARADARSRFFCCLEAVSRCLDLDHVQCRHEFTDVMVDVRQYSRHGTLQPLAWPVTLNSKCRNGQGRVDDSLYS
jgi:hypothetical protein